MKFSILTACYNNGRFLDQYFHSVLSQQYPELEIIFVDDCSTDDSLQKARAIQDSRLKIFVNEQKKYCSGTYAMALSCASGDICGVVDADDVLVDGAVETIVKLYESHPEIDYIYTQHYWCDIDLKIVRKGVSSLPYGNFVLTAMKRRHGFSHWRTFKRHLAARAVIFPEGLRYAVDKEMGFVLEEVGQGGYYDAPLYYYRYYPGNMSLSFATKQRETVKNLIKKHMHDRSSKNIIIQKVVRVL